MAQTERKSVTARLQRFQIDRPVSVIVKNARSRCTCFWFNLANVSASGVGLSYQGRGFIPYQAGDIIHLTVDLSAAVFERPIHLTAIVRRRSENTSTWGDSIVTETFLGAEILAHEELHHAVWVKGLSALGDPYKQDTVAQKPRKRLV